MEHQNEIMMQPEMPEPALAMNPAETVGKIEKEVPPDPAAPLLERFSKYGAGCLLTGLFYAFCFYKNPNGITWPFFLAAGLVLVCAAFQSLSVKIRKDSWFSAAAILLIGVSMCRTDSLFLHTINRVALFFLLAFFLLHQLCDDSGWDIGTAISSALRYAGGLFLLLPVPFSHGIRYFKTSRQGKKGPYAAAILGAFLSLPFVLIVVCLLGDADVVFNKLLVSALDGAVNPSSVSSVLFQTVVSAAVFYCILCSRYKMKFPEGVRDRRKGSPAFASGFLFTFAAAYLVFCAIQVVFLFLRKGTLPDGMTYAEYARQGFFQLTFVIALNLALVLGFLRYFRPAPYLKALLTAVSACTCVMIASAACRMLLYISVYRLTLLRLLVLWFLGTAAVFMAGVFLLIRKERFPLFRYGLVVVSVFYTALALSRPDAVIAAYNLTAPGHEAVGTSDLYYLQTLSLDAAPAMEKYLEDSPELTEWYGGRDVYLAEFCRKAADSDGNASLRTYNFSVGAARKIYDARSVGPE